MMLFLASCTTPMTSSGCPWTRVITVDRDRDPVLSRHLMRQIAAHNISWRENCAGN